MATGIQTGMRTGSRGGLSGSRTGLGKGGEGGGGPLGKAKEIWQGMGAPLKYGIIGLVVIVVLGFAAMGIHTQKNSYVSLFEIGLDPSDVTESSSVLTTRGIPHALSETRDGIMVHPDQVASARLILGEEGLPRLSSLSAAAVEESAMNPKSTAAVKAAQKAKKEKELAYVIRQVDGVSSAVVQLAIPEGRSYFQSEQSPVTASIFLKVANGARIQQSQVKAMIHNVAFSVPNLKSENINIMDQNGNNLSASATDSDISTAPLAQMEFKGALEKVLQDKAAGQLRQVYGDKATVTINADLDYSQIQKEQTVVGGPGDGGKVEVGRKVFEEVYSKDSPSDSGEVAQLSTASSGAKSGDYSQRTEVIKVEANNSKTIVIENAPRVKRLTASVAIDGLPKEQEANVAGMVAGAIGIDEARGDVVNVSNVNFARSPVGAGVAGAVPVVFPEATGENPLVGASGAGSLGQSVALALGIVALGGLGLIGLFLVKRHGVQANQGQLILGSTMTSNSSDIADLLNEKSGNIKETSTGAAETSVNTSEQLQKLAKERPNKVAEVLKSTWLSNK